MNTYEMTEEDYKELLETCKPVPLIMLQTGMPSSTQDKANRWWERLGKKMGFRHMTVKPIPDKGEHWFSAEPTETYTIVELRNINEEDLFGLYCLGYVDGFSDQTPDLFARVYQTFRQLNTDGRIAAVHAFEMLKPKEKNNGKGKV